MSLPAFRISTAALSGGEVRLLGIPGQNGTDIKVDRLNLSFDNLTNSLQRAQFAADHLPTLAMPTHHAVRQMVRNNVDYLPVDQVFGRVATTMFVVYPPGIATIVPGERLDERARPMLDYLKIFERSANLFPGFDVEIQGIYRETEKDGTVRFYTYVVRE